MNPALLSRLFAAQQEPQWGPNPYARQQQPQAAPPPPMGDPPAPHFLAQGPADLWGQPQGGDMWDERAPSMPLAEERPESTGPMDEMFLPDREMSPARAMDVEYGYTEGEDYSDAQVDLAEKTMREAGISHSRDPNRPWSAAPFYQQGGELIPPSQTYYDDLGEPPGPRGVRQPGLNDLISMDSTEPDTWNGPTQVMEQSPMPRGGGPQITGAPILGEMFGPPAPPSLPRMTSR